MIEMAKIKLKPILPSLREKKRYLVFQVISNEKINNADAVSDAIWRSSLQFIGLLGVAKAGLMVLNNKWNKELQRGIIKVSNHYSDKIRISFLFINKINNYDVIVQTRGISGILKKARGRFLYN